MEKQNLNVAILSMYRDPDAQGLRYIQSLLKQESEKYPQGISSTLFQTRAHNEMPALEDFDLFISTGGPGNPFDGEGSDWEIRYFEFLKAFQVYNELGEKPKFHFSICHSFQLLCRFFHLAEVRLREEKARFGIFPVYAGEEGKKDSLFGLLPEPYLAVENRSWECVNAREKQLSMHGIKVLARENEHPDSALLALRISPFWVATQFHPETNPEEMKQLFSTEKKKQEVDVKFSPEKWEGIMNHLNQQNPSLAETYQCLLPEFIKAAIAVRNA